MSERGTEQMTEKQRRIVESALEVFSERGFAGASTSEIAKRAGVAEGTIFRHYKTKKDLLIGVVAPFFFRFVAPALLREVVDLVEEDHATFEDFVRALYKNRLQFLRRHEQRIRVVAQELPFHPEVRALVEEQIVATMLPKFTGLIERFQEKGEIVRVEPSSVLRIIMSMMTSYAALRFVFAPHREWDDEAENELNIKVVVDGLRPRARDR